MRKSTYGLHWSTKISAFFAEKIQRIPQIILVMICGALMIATGTLSANYNIEVSALVSAKVWTPDVFEKLCLLTVAMLLVDRGTKAFMKAFVMKKINSEYRHIFSRVRKSKVADINEVTIGKAMDSATEICKFNSDQLSYWFNFIPCIIPFVTMIVKVGTYDWRMGATCICGVIVSVIIMLLNEKFFAWDEKAKRMKGKLKSITTDNFMNIATCKYIHEDIYPDKRLKDIQDESFKYEINVFAISIYTFVLVALWIPSLINAYIARDNMEMVAYVLLNDYVIQRMSDHLISIIDNRIECKNAEKNIEQLKADDVEADEIFEGVMELAGTEFSHKKSDDEDTVITFKIDDVVLKQGNRYLVEGQSGSGKSSFATWLAGGLRTQKGFDKRYRTFYIWQETTLFNDTLINNIIPNVPKDSKEFEVQMERINAIAEKLDILDFIQNETPNGWYSVAGERGCRLSSGQKQRINLIRALIAMIDHPEYIFILDEITSNLDAKTRKLAFEMINEYCHSTLIMISHNKGFEGYVDDKIKVVDHVLKMVKPRNRNGIKVTKAS